MAHKKSNSIHYKEHKPVISTFDQVSHYIVGDKILVCDSHFGTYNAIIGHICACGCHISVAPDNVTSIDVNDLMSFNGKRNRGLDIFKQWVLIDISVITPLN